MSSSMSNDRDLFDPAANQTPLRSPFPPPRLPPGSRNYGRGGRGGRGVRNGRGVTRGNHGFRGRRRAPTNIRVVRDALGTHRPVRVTQPSRALPPRSRAGNKKRSRPRFEAESNGLIIVTPDAATRRDVRSTALRCMDPSAPMEESIVHDFPVVKPRALERGDLASIKADPTSWFVSEKTDGEFVVLVHNANAGVADTDPRCTPDGVDNPLIDNWWIMDTKKVVYSFVRNEPKRRRNNDGSRSGSTPARAPETSNLACPLSTNNRNTYSTEQRRGGRAETGAPGITRFSDGWFIFAAELVFNTDGIFLFLFDVIIFDGANAYESWPFERRIDEMHNVLPTPDKAPLPMRAAGVRVVPKHFLPFTAAGSLVEAIRVDNIELKPTHPSVYNLVNSPRSDVLLPSLSISSWYTRLTPATRIKIDGVMFVKARGGNSYDAILKWKPNELSTVDLFVSGYTTRISETDRRGFLRMISGPVHQRPCCRSALLSSDECDFIDAKLRAWHENERTTPIAEFSLVRGEWMPLKIRADKVRSNSPLTLASVAQVINQKIELSDLATDQPDQPDQPEQPDQPDQQQSDGDGDGGEASERSNSPDVTYDFDFLI